MLENPVLMYGYGVGILIVSAMLAAIGLRFNRSFLYRLIFGGGGVVIGSVALFYLLVYLSLLWPQFYQNMIISEDWTAENVPFFVKVFCAGIVSVVTAFVGSIMTFPLFGFTFILTALSFGSITPDGTLLRHSWHARLLLRAMEWTNYEDTETNLCTLTWFSGAMMNKLVLLFALDLWKVFFYFVLAPVVVFTATSTYPTRQTWRRMQQGTLNIDNAWYDWAPTIVQRSSLLAPDDRIAYLGHSTRGASTLRLVINRVGVGLDCGHLRLAVG